MKLNNRLFKCLICGLWSVEKIFGAALLFMGIYSTILFAEDNGRNLGMIAWYFAFAGVIMVVSLVMGENAKYIMMAILFGVRRREAFVGMQFTNIILTLQNMIIFAVVLKIFPDNTGIPYDNAIFLYAVAMIFLFGAGQILFVISYRYGNIKALLTFVFTMVVVFASMSVLLLVQKGFITFLFDGIPLPARFGIATVAVLIYGVGVLISRNMINKYEVRA